MESRERYVTHTRLHVVLYTSRVPLSAVVYQPSERMDDDTRRRTSIFLGIYVRRQPTSTRTTSNVFIFSCSYIQMDWSRQSHRYSKVKTAYFSSRWLSRRRFWRPILGERRKCWKMTCSTNNAKLWQVGAFRQAHIFHRQAHACASGFLLVTFDYLTVAKPFLHGWHRGTVCVVDYKL